MSIKVGIDTGGTFTDLVAVDPATETWLTSKVPSTPREPLVAILHAIDKAGIDPANVSLLILGTTIGTNALIERKGAKVAYLTTEGFEDVPFIQRGNRKFHYDLHWIKPHPFVDRRDCVGIKERVDHNGRVKTPLALSTLGPLEQQIQQRMSNGLQALAVSFLFSYVNPSHEKGIAGWLAERFPELPVSLSHQVAPVWREYERGLTTIADAYLKPLFKEFISKVDVGLRDRGFKGTWALMKSNGGNRLAREAGQEPVQLLLSGVAGGVIGGKTFGLVAGQDLITVDMGGTSCDIAVIIGGEQRYATQFQVEFGLPLALPIVDVSTIGAGGGSIGWIDGGGFLRVGPRSAGADPGPACYGRGGIEPTVTDANLVLGRLSPDFFLGGALWLDADRSLDAVSRLGRSVGLSSEEAALAVIEIANENMVNAIRVRTVEVGIDPRGFTLVAFGGAGPLHASAIARSLGIRRVLIPPHPGLCSAFGALAADLRADKVWTAAYRSHQVKAEDLAVQVQRLSKAAVEELRAEGYGGDVHLSVTLGMRYAGQNYEHDVGVPAAPITEDTLRRAFERFSALHKEFYGYHLGGEVIEIVNVSVTAVGPVDLHLPPPLVGSGPAENRSRQARFRVPGLLDTIVCRRDALPTGATVCGPAIIEEPDATTLVEPGDRLTVLETGAMVIDVK